MVIISIKYIITIISESVEHNIVFHWQAGWNLSVEARILYELDYKKPVLYVIPIESILGKLPVVPVGDTGT
jgi:hypothetical protein